MGQGAEVVALAGGGCRRLPGDRDVLRLVRGTEGRHAGRHRRGRHGGVSVVRRVPGARGRGRLPRSLRTLTSRRMPVSTVSCAQARNGSSTQSQNARLSATTPRPLALSQPLHEAFAVSLLRPQVAPALPLPRGSRASEDLVLITTSKTGTHMHHRCVYSAATPMARRNKRRKPRSPRAVSPPAATSRPPSAAAGARVARVAVDDETWAAFRELCGSTPASVRLGDLVRAEVARATTRRDPSADALLALRVIADQADALEAYVRAQSSD
jgi:hypothetical protein